MGAAVGYLLCDTNGRGGTPVGLDPATAKARQKAALRNERSRSITLFDNSIFAKAPCCCAFHDNGLPIEVSNAEVTRIFTVTLEKQPSVPFGLDVDVVPTVDYLPVSQIHPCSLVAEWNANHPEARVEIGDRLIEVNQISNDPDGMMSACQIDNLLRLVFLRPSGYGEDEQRTPQKGISTGVGTPLQHPTPSTGLTGISREGVAGALDTVDSDGEADAVALGAMITNTTFSTPRTPQASTQDSKGVKKQESHPEEEEEADFDDDDFMGAPVKGATPSTFPSKM